MNKVITFVEFCNEMASSTGQNGNTFNRSGEWNTFYKTSEFTKLLYKDLGTNKYKFYKHGSELYFLIDKNDNYIGHIELNDSKITSHHTTLLHNKLLIIKNYD
jgi:hypothetical protein